MYLTAIGTIFTPYKELTDMPIQPTGARGVAGRIELRADLINGLKDLDGFLHIIVLYQFHRVKRIDLQVIPFLDREPRGVFATRAPTRPNPLGLSVLALKNIGGNSLAVEDVDMLDGTPLLDIKPYIPAFDRPEQVRTGWLQEASTCPATARSDGRFV